MSFDTLQAHSSTRSSNADLLAALVEPSGLVRRKILRADLLDAGVAYLHELYKIITGSKSLITLTDKIRTPLFIDGPVHIQAEEHWLQDNSSWSCNSSTIHRLGKIVGRLNLSCPFDKSHEHSLGLIVALVNAIEREL